MSLQRKLFKNQHTLLLEARLLIAPSFKISVCPKRCHAEVSFKHLHYIMVYRFRNKFGIYASNLLDSPI